MKILKQSIKKILFIFIFLIFAQANSNEPVDIWDISQKKNNQNDVEQNDNNQSDTIENTQTSVTISGGNFVTVPLV